MWVEAGQPAHTFWQQTQRSFANTLAGAAVRDITLAWKIANMTGAAWGGNLPPLDKLLAPETAPASKGKFVSDEQRASASLLGFMFKMKRRGVPMEIERIERLH